MTCAKKTATKKAVTPKSPKKPQHIGLVKNDPCLSLTKLQSVDVMIMQNG